MTINNHRPTVDGFGDEWERFDQSALPEGERVEIFDRYFSLFPWSSLAENAVGFDMGCGSGRWAKLVAPRVGRLHCIDPSAALLVAKRNLADNSNCVFHNAGVGDITLPAESMDFGYSLGVLHHVPDTAAGIAACAAMLKPGAPLLLYLYYAFDNRPLWFRLLWRFSDVLRLGVSRLPHSLRYIASQIIASLIYWPLARFAALAERLGANASTVVKMPLSIYKAASFYTMRTDALDRFGTRLEQRFTRVQISQMMQAVGLEKIRFSEELPHWCAIGFKVKFPLP